MVARVWLCPYVDAKNGRRETLCVVHLEHHNLTGALSLHIRAPESEVVVDGGINRVLPGKSAIIPFSVASTVGRVMISPKPTGFDYVLLWGGNAASEVQQRTIESLEPLMPAGVAVEVGPTVECKAGKSFYQLHVTANGESKLLSKRFSEFADVYERVKDAYAGSHLRSNVPAPPKKVINPFVNQLDPDFVEMRRVELNDFIKKMVTLPRVLVNPALLHFLGLALRPLES